MSKKSNNSIRAYFGGIQNFLKYKGITVSSGFIGNIPPSVEKAINHKHEWRIADLKEFIQKAPTMRDKAIILCLFQSGLGVNELVNFFNMPQNARAWKILNTDSYLKVLFVE